MHLSLLVTEIIINLKNKKITAVTDSKQTSVLHIELRSIEQNYKYDCFIIKSIGILYNIPIFSN